MELGAGYLHPSQLVVDEGSETEVPEWRRQQNEAKLARLEEEEEESRFGKQNSRRAAREAEKKKRLEEKRAAAAAAAADLG